MKKLILALMLLCTSSIIFAKPISKPIVEGGSYVLVDYQKDLAVACLTDIKPSQASVFIWFDDKNQPRLNERPMILIKGKIPPLCYDGANNVSNLDKAMLVDKATIKENGFILPLKNHQILTKNRQIVGIDLDNDKKADKITQCFSNEGQHLNVWTSAKKNAKLAHAYQYLNMGLEANCTKQEY